jgi:hemoglobin-like flavoprotein
MSPIEREQRLKFLSLTEHDEQLLKALRPLFEKHVAAVEDEFYDHLLSFPETARLFDADH